MKKSNQVLEDLQSSVHSSTSSYSEVIPRQENISQVRKDKPIVIKSIPMNKYKSPSLITPSVTQSKKQSITLINSTHAYSALSQSNISAEVYTNQGSNSRNFNSTKHIENQEIIHQKQMIFNENLVKSTYENYRQYFPSSEHQQSQAKNLIESSKNNEIQLQVPKEDGYENVALDFSMSSMNSEKPQSISPKQPFKMYLDPSPPRSPQNKYEVVRPTLPNTLNQKRKQQQFRDSPIRAQSYHLQTVIKKNHQLQEKIRQYEALFKTETQSMIMERKANEIYTEFYQTLSKMVTKFVSINKDEFSFGSSSDSEPLNQSLNMEKILQTVEKLIQTFSLNLNQTKIQTTNKYVQADFIPQIHIPKEANLKPHQVNRKIQQLQVLLQTSEQKNKLLRSELLQSTQNNINSLFNTEISASCCLQNQVSKINSEMTFLKEKINLILLQNQTPSTVINQQPLPPQIIYLSNPNPQVVHPLNERKQNNLVKIYTTKSRIRESDDQSDSIESNQKSKRRHSFSRKNKRSSKSQRQRSDSSLSSKSTKKREQLSKKEIQSLKQAYNQTKNELNSLIQTFSLITNSQNQMKGYFTQVKEEIIRAMNQKMKLSEEEQKKKQQFENQRVRKIQEIHKREKELGQQYEAKMNLQLAQKIKIKQDSYINHIQFMKSERQQDRKVIQNLNQKVIELLNAIAVPQKVNQEPYHSKTEIPQQDEIPLSQICVSVDYLKMIEQLKTQKKKQQAEIQGLMKENSFLKNEITELKFIQRPKSAINIHDSPNFSNQEKSSIINQLNGFTEMCIPAPPNLITTGSNHLLGSNKSNKTIKSNKHVTFHNFNSSVADKFTPSIQRIESQKLMKAPTDSQKNLQNNLKVILQSKQAQIKSFEQQILNLEETIQYLKGEMNTKQKIIEELENYVLNLESKSLNSIALSSQAINLPEPNLYSDPMASPELLKHKYENYVKNLKLLLKETRNENMVLKEQIHNFETQVDQRTESNFNLKNSATHSERTTKNFHGSSPVQIHHHKTSAEIMIRKRTQNTEKFENQRQQQRINSLAYDSQLPEPFQSLKTKGRFPSMQ